MGIVVSVNVCIFIELFSSFAIKDFFGDDNDTYRFLVICLGYGFNKIYLFESYTEKQSCDERALSGLS